MNNSIVIVAKGDSLFDKKIGSIIDTFNTVIRVNHIPTSNLHNVVGSKTDIYAGRDTSKTKQFSESLKCKQIWHCHPEDLLTNKDKDFLTTLTNQLNVVKYMSPAEMDSLKQNFDNKYNPVINKSDRQYNFCLPDTGITALWLALHRFNASVIYVCGFDHYMEGNKSIYGVQKNSSIFNTPVLTQLFFYNKMLKLQKIHEL